MIIHHPSKRRAASMLARCGVALSVVGLGISAWNMSFSGVPRAGAAAAAAGEVLVVHPADAGPDAGLPLATGGSSTPFSLKLPQGAACTLDSPNDDYRVQSYMVPESVSPADLAYDSAGPTPAGYGGDLAAFRMPLWEVTQDDYVDRGTAAADTPPGPGQILDIPALSFDVYVELGVGAIPVGTYNVGIACTDADRAGDKYWNARMTFTADASDPLGVVWAVAEGGGGTTTTTIGDGSTTTTTGDGSTTTTTGGETTTTTIGDGSTTTTTFDVSGGGFTGGTPSAASPVTTAGQLPYTGSSPVPMVVWAVALVVFGRMAMLLGKRPKVVGDDPTG